MRILIVDDDKDFAASLGEFLELGGYDVDLAFRSDAGIDAAIRENYHQIIMDIGLPDKRGTESASIIHNVQPDTPILLITGHRTTHADQAIIDSSALEVLTKPLNLESLL